MIARLATGLKKLPAEVLTMTLPQIYDLSDYWKHSPPEHEVLAILAAAYTTWKPQGRPMTEAEHRASLEARWKSGAMNVKQMFEAMGGAISVDGSKGVPSALLNPPGIGPFPGLRG